MDRPCTFTANSYHDFSSIEPLRFDKSVGHRTGRPTQDHTRTKAESRESTSMVHKLHLNLIYHSHVDNLALARAVVNLPSSALNSIANQLTSVGQSWPGACRLAGPFLLWRLLSPPARVHRSHRRVNRALHQLVQSRRSKASGVSSFS